MTSDDAILKAARLAMATVSPGGGWGRLSILIYHRVRPRCDPLFPEEVDAQRFDQHLSFVARVFNVIPLIEAVQMLRDGVLPARAACITFDDGYADNVEVALPILQRHTLTATFFISTGYLDGGRMWNDTIIESVRSARQEALDLTSIGLPIFHIASIEEKRAAISRLISLSKYLDPGARQERCAAVREIAGAELPDDLMLRAEQVRTLHDAGMGIGAHTVSHPILARLPSELAKQEIAEGRSALEALIAAPVRIFAYPNGRPGVDYGREHVNIVRSLGFDGAVSTGWGAGSRRIDPFQLPRFTPWDQTSARMAIGFVRNLLRPVTTMAL
jgi:peptidoglycan/xylan/chitin deacetylase (PgdA/CDA1 family)